MASMGKQIGDLRAGVYTIMPTPFTDSGELDVGSLESVTAFLLSTGVDGLAILGVMGEAQKLVGNERAEVVKQVLRTVAGRVPVVIGTTHESAIGARTLSEAAQEAGASGVLLAAPRGSNSDLELIRRHYEFVGRSLTIPIVIHDYPASTGVVMSPELVAELHSSVDVVRYIKLEEAPTVPKMSRLRQLCGSSLGIFGGLGGVFFLEELLTGAMGTMTGFAYPEILREVYGAFSSQDLERARETFYRYLPLIRFEFQEGIGLAIRKRIYRLRGAIATDTVRAPGRQLDEETARQLDDLLARFAPVDRPLTMQP